MSKFVIGISGFKGVGKDTLADALETSVNKLPMIGSIGRFAFASPLYAMMDAFLPFIGVDPKKEPTTRENKESPLPVIGGSRRVLLQTLGTEWGRTLDQDFWLKILEARINSSRFDVVMVTDVRFDNEAKLIHDRGGFIINIERPGFAPKEHASEKGIDPKYVDLTIVSDGTEEEFKNWVSRRLWDIIWLFAKAGQNKHQLFPMKVSIKDKIESSPEPRNKLVKYATTVAVLEMIKKFGVVISHERLQELTAELRKEGLIG